MLSDLRYCMRTRSGSIHTAKEGEEERKRKEGTISDEINKETQLHTFVVQKRINVATTSMQHHH